MARIYIPSDGGVELLDDFDFKTDARTVRFSLDGVHYEVDLSAANVQKLQACLEPFIRVSHIVKREDIRAVTTDVGSAGLDFAPSESFEGGYSG